MPSETRSYVPSLLAIAEVLKNSDKYKINFGEIKNSSYFEVIDVKLDNRKTKSLDTINKVTTKKIDLVTKIDEKNKDSLQKPITNFFNKSEIVIPS